MKIRKLFYFFNTPCFKALLHVHKIVKTFSKESTIALMMAHTFSYVPDDYNRVVLDSIPREPDSDYVNASYVDVSNIFCFLL